MGVGATVTGMDTGMDTVTVGTEMNTVGDTGMEDTGMEDMDMEDMGGVTATDMGMEVNY